MKFGLESEKFLFNMKKQKPSQGVFRFIDALSDFPSESSITNEFVLNMVEIVTKPSERPIDIINDYVSNYLKFNYIASRESVTMVGMGSLPMDYQPHMSPKWQYIVQNSILDNKLHESWMMNKESPLTPAGNCAGVHVHIEIETMPEYLFSTRELQDKFNMGLMLTPMIAFSSSPYFFGVHEANSMRAQRYFNGVYKEFPHNGGLPPVMTSSQEVLMFFHDSSEIWIKAAKTIGIPQEDILKLVSAKGASWNPIRWNRKWNTIEFRCLDSDRIDLDCSKFVWVCGAMKRVDIQGEALKCKPIESDEKLNESMIDLCFSVSEGWVNILPSHAISELFQMAISEGLKNPLVEKFLHRLSNFARTGLDQENIPIFNILHKRLDSKLSTSDLLLENFGRDHLIDNQLATDLVNFTIEDEKRVMRNLIRYFPDTSNEIDKFTKLSES